MSQWQFPRDHWKYDRMNPAKKKEKSLTELRQENQRLQALLKQLQQQMAQLQPVTHRGRIPEEYQLELMRGRKLANLYRKGDTVQFSGIGMNGIYGVEGYAECLMRKNHEVPHPDCSCGFYVPVELSEGGRPEGSWVLDVEIGGKVLDCGMGALPAPARGYRASWQRVLSVTAPLFCKHCHATAEHVCILSSNSIEALCPKCASRMSRIEEEKPLSWVREHLATELVAPNLTDALPPEGIAPSLPDWERDLLQRGVTFMGTAPTVWPTSFPLTLPTTYTPSTGTTVYPTYYQTYTTSSWPGVTWGTNPLAPPQVDPPQE